MKNNDCLTHKSPWNLILDNSIPWEKMIPEKYFQSLTSKKVTVQVYSLEKYTLRLDIEASYSIV